MPNDVLKENEVKPGLRVKIHPSSMFSSQTPLAGTVLHDNGDDEEYDEEERDFIWYHVRFDDGYSNDYRHFDLMHADAIPANNKQAAILLKTTLSE